MSPPHTATTTGSWSPWAPIGNVRGSCFLGAGPVGAELSGPGTSGLSHLFFPCHPTELVWPASPALPSCLAARNSSTGTRATCPSAPVQRPFSCPRTQVEAQGCCERFTEVLPPAATEGRASAPLPGSPGGLGSLLSSLQS